jgi:hypothetical protein
MDKITLGDLFRDYLKYIEDGNSELEIFGNTYKTKFKTQRLDYYNNEIFVIWIDQYKIQYEIYHIHLVKITDCSEIPSKIIFCSKLCKEVSETTLKSIIGVSPVKSARN